MRRWLEPIAVCVLTAAVLTVTAVRAPVARYAYESGNLLRLHVIAASDQGADQERKLMVRDVVVAQLSDLLAGADTVAEARAIVERSLPGLERAVTALLSEYGEAVPVRLELGKWAFPDRAYGRLVIPAGDYEALRVIIGEGRGQNWWCVLFPPLCFLELGQDREQAVQVLAQARDDGLLAYETDGDRIRITWWTVRAFRQVSNELSAVWHRVQAAVDRR